MHLHHHQAARCLHLDNSGTDLTSFLWSGDILMDLDRSQALKITPKSIDGSNFLFIEAGGFDPKNPIGWKSQQMVLKCK